MLGRERPGPIRQWHDDGECGADECESSHGRCCAERRDSTHMRAHRHQQRPVLGSEPAGRARRRAPRTDSSTPVDADQLLDARMVSAARQNHTCAVRATGTVTCWGANERRTGGVETVAASRRTRPTDVIGVSHVKHISAGRLVTCATVASGEVLCWGRNAAGQFGNNSTIDSPTPTPAASSFFSKFAVSVGGEHACAMSTALTSTAVPGSQARRSNAGGRIRLDSWASAPRGRQPRRRNGCRHSAPPSNSLRGPRIPAY